MHTSPPHPILQSIHEDVGLCYTASVYPNSYWICAAYEALAITHPHRRQDRENMDASAYMDYGGENMAK